MKLIDRLNTNDGFAARMYRALGRFMAHRLRSTNVRVGQDSSPGDEDEDADEIDLDLLDTLDLAAARYQAMLGRLGGSAN